MIAKSAILLAAAASAGLIAMSQYRDMFRFAYSQSPNYGSIDYGSIYLARKRSRRAKAVRRYR